jgi:hypothetical protein
MVAEDDWRLDFAKRHLQGASCRWKKWYPASETWDHDHCAGCWAKFCLHDNCESHQEGYAVTAGYKWGEDYEWVCASCFDALKDNLGWTVVGPPNPAGDSK